MKTIKQIFALLFIAINVVGQTDSTNFYEQIKHYDLSKLLKDDSLLIMDDSVVIQFPEPLGFIGENYERFRIHFTTVEKNKKLPYQYIIKGKTKIKNEIKPFIGTLSITKAFTYNDEDYPKQRVGSVEFSVSFYEDSTYNSSGKFTGVLISDFVLSSKGKILYNTLWFVADGYCNNQAKTIWVCYKSRESKKCNWGDFRIPDSGDLDDGVSEFNINEKYRNNGWQSFIDVNNEKSISDSAFDIKKLKWWK